MSKSYIKFLTECIKTAGRLIEENAESIAGKEDCITNLNISIDFDQEKRGSIPEITINRSFVPSSKEAERLFIFKKETLKLEVVEIEEET